LTEETIRIIKGEEERGRGEGGRNKPCKCVDEGEGRELDVNVCRTKKDN
jgi:hypothetical protein